MTTSARVREYLRNNVLGLIAIWIALGGVAWAAGAVPTGPAGGDLTGTYPDPAIKAGAVDSAKIQNGQVGKVDINSAEVQRRVASVCTGGQAIRKIAADGTVTCEATSTSGPPSGPVPAGGDLTGSYPAPTIAEDAVDSSNIGKLSDLEFEVSNPDPFNPTSNASITLIPPIVHPLPATLEIDAPQVAIDAPTRITDGLDVGSVNVLGTLNAYDDVSLDEGVKLKLADVTDMKQVAPGSVSNPSSNTGRIYVRSLNGDLQLAIRWPDGSIDVLAAGPPVS